MSSVPATFKAYTYESYGPTETQIAIRPVATEPLPANHIRIKVHSAALNPVDWCLVEFLGAQLTGSSPSKENPYRIGFDAAGEVAELGEGVDATKFKLGDAVYAMTPFSKFGTLAEYVDVDQAFVALKPASLSFDEAASLPLAVLTTYQALYEHTKLQAGQRVLILGGSSSTGIYAVQFAKTIGAHVITTTSAKNAAFVKSLGADEVIDYHTQKWVDVVENHSIDVVYDCGMEPNSWNDEAQTVLKKETGQFITLQFQENPAESKFGAKNLGQMMVYPSARDLTAINKQIEEGKLKTVIDSVFPFDKAIDGVTQVKSRRSVGKVVIKVL